MAVKEHYEQHLGGFYSWMVGDFKSKVVDFQEFLAEQEISPEHTVQ